MKLLAKVFLPSALLLHISLIILRGYFLSAEFTIYPYLTSHGFLPYKNLIDQHFPSIFFGPISLPAFLTSNQFSLLLIFLSTLLLTDLFLYYSLQRFKVKNAYVWLVFYIVSSVYFSGYILWVETFVNLFISLWLFLSSSRSKLPQFVCGFLLSQVLLLRPTIAPAITLAFFLISRLSVSVVVGGLSGFLIPILFLYQQHLFSDFYRLAFQFNQNIYPTSARILPSKRQIVSLLFWLIPPLIAFIKKRRFVLVVLSGLIFLLAFPRFGFEHLQPLFLLTTFFFAKTEPRPNLSVYLFIVLFFCLNLYRGIRYPYGNFYFNEEIKNYASQVERLDSSHVYLLGVPDILYPLSRKLPPQGVYLPSLPWYLGETDFQDKVIQALTNTKIPILINFEAEVDRQRIVNENNPIVKYIRMNYHEEEKIGSYQLFYPNL